jgi:hypothetical protein
MNCKKIKELLITDYSDGEIKERIRGAVDRHLRTCDSCREFKEVVRKTAIEPFRKAREVKPPDYVWLRIKEAIIKEESYKPGGIFVDLADFLRRLIYIPRPAFVMATATGLLLAATIFTRMVFYPPRTAGSYLEENMVFFAYLGNGEANYYDDSNTGLGTSIEEYFF